MILEEVKAALADTVTEWGSSRYSEYRRCPKAHHLKFELGIENAPKDPEKLESGEGEPVYFQVGRLCHAVLRYVQEGVMAGTPRLWTDVIEVAATLPESDLEQAHHAERLMGAYFLNHGEANAGWPEGTKILGTELLYESRVGSAPYTGRVDTLLQINDRILIVDTKTRAKAFPGDRERYARGAATRPQFLGLAYLVKEKLQLEEPPSIWINAIIKTKVPKFDRLIVPISNEAIAQWAEEQSRFLPIAGDDRMNYSACAPEGYGARCQFFNYCHLPQTRETQYRKRT